MCPPPQLSSWLRACQGALPMSAENFFNLFLLSFATRTGSPQRHVPITVGPLPRYVDFSEERKPEYPEKHRRDQLRELNPRGRGSYLEVRGLSHHISTKYTFYLF